MDFDVVTVGSATRDVFMKTDAQTISICHSCKEEKMLAYPLGSKVLVSDMEFHIGGGGTNTACTFARQGLKTGFIGKIGKDTPGYAIIKFLKEENITFLGAVGKQTGFSVILDSEEQDRTILVFKGCNSSLTMNDLDLEKINTKWLYCTSMVGPSYDALKEIMRYYHAKGAKIVFNCSAYQAQEGIGHLQPLFDITDTVIMNKEEAQLLMGNESEDVHELLHVIQAAGPTTVAITDGAKGVWVLQDKIYHAYPSPNVHVVETTGAGDAFGSGFIAGLARNLGMKKAIQVGMENAEHVLSKFGAKHHILSKKETDTILKKPRAVTVQ